ncbi:MAG TPA: plasmid partition protein ParG [Coleofasciculaceae cyanobacterium]
MSEAENQVFVRGRVPESVRARFKATCALEGRDMSEVLRELIEKWLQEHENPSPTKKGKGNE